MSTVEVSPDGLRLAGWPVADLARMYGTPVVLLDADDIRRRMRAAQAAWREAPAGSRLVYAGKALDLTAVFRIAHEEGLDADIVSEGEGEAALRAGFDPGQLWFHGNAKTDAELVWAVRRGVGRIVVDGLDELDRLQAIASQERQHPGVLLRLTPEGRNRVEKFGLSRAEVRFAVAQWDARRPLRLLGLHGHLGAIPLGSVSTTSEPFQAWARWLVGVAAELQHTVGYWPEEINVGGGFGIPAGTSDEAAPLEQTLTAVVAAVREATAAMGRPMPRLFAEPGRAFVGPAGVTVYTVQAVKGRDAGSGGADAPIVAVDGGVGDNPRPMLYGARAGHPVVLVTRPQAPGDDRYHVVGRYCDAADVIASDVPLDRPRRGDLLAVLNTGAYSLPLSSQYNGVPRPPVVLVSRERARLIVRRETLSDLWGREVE